VIAAAARIGAVHLTIADLGRSIEFYEGRLGFRVHRRDGAGAGAALGAGGPDLLVLESSPHAPRARGTTGLYHFAILVPSRLDLARALRQLAVTGTALQGAADHGVSEALYLADPDGNGIEIYRDRDRAEWPFVNGRLAMGADPIDLEALLADSGEAGPALDSATTIGHVHLHVANLPDAHRFYVETLGFALTQRYGPSALFVAAGDYHHHVGLNTWIGVGAPPPPPGAIGLKHFEVKLPDRAALDAVVERLRAARVPVDARDGAALLRDPSANAILLTIET
jgi:catechol 2,3-dioxygenase